MISKYLKSKNIITQIIPTVDESTLLMDTNYGFYDLNLYNFTSQYYFYRELFNDYELSKILMICKKLPKQQASINDNEINNDYRKSTVSWVPVNKETQWIYQKLTRCIFDANKSLFEYDLTRIEKLQFTNYYGEERGFYLPHLDIDNGHLPDNRKLTFVLQLSNPNEYEGGELRLHMSKSPTIIPKEKGLITFFPSHILHECTPVISGKRNTLVGWVHGPKFK